MVTSSKTCICRIFLVVLALMLFINYYEMSIDYAITTDSNLFPSTLTLGKAKSEKKELLFIHIPKTAGTSIERAAYRHNVLWGHEMMKHSLFTNLTREMCASSHLCAPYPWHVPLKYFTSYFENKLADNRSIFDEILPYFDLSAKSKYDYFCVVRNPFARIVSDYKYLISYPSWSRQLTQEIKQYNEWGQCSAESLNSWIEVALEQYGKQRKKDFARRFCVDGCHLIEQYHFTEQSQCRHIIHFESLQEEITNLFNKNEIKNQYQNIYDNGSNIADTLAASRHSTLGALCSGSGTASLSVLNLTKTTKDIIYNFYERDFVEFGYEYTVVDEVENAIKAHISHIDKKEKVSLSPPPPRSTIYNYNITVVTSFYFDDRSAYGGHNISRWVAAIRRLYYLHYPLIIFGDDHFNQTYASMLSIRYGYNNSKYPDYPPAYFIHLDSANDFIFNRETELYHKREQSIRSLTACKAWANKFFFTYYVALFFNPFKSKYFMYIDAGFLRDPVRQNRILFNEEHLSAALSYGNGPVFSWADGHNFDEICTAYLHGRPHRALGPRSFTGGGLFIGSTESIQTFTYLYYRFFYKGITENYKGMCYDQGCFSAVICNNPSSATLVHCNDSREVPDGVFALYRYIRGQCVENLVSFVNNGTYHRQLL